MTALSTVSSQSAPAAKTRADSRAAILDDFAGMTGIGDAAEREPKPPFVPPGWRLLLGPGFNGLPFQPDPAVDGLPFQPEPSPDGLPYEPAPDVAGLPFQPEPAPAGLPFQPDPAVVGMPFQPERPPDGLPFELPSTGNGLLAPRQLAYMLWSSQMDESSK